ncbi:MAG: homoserine dehydrogenase [Pontixanthobacter sp.]
MTSPLNTRPLRVGIAGLGTVGVGVVKLLEGNAALIAARAGRPIQIVAVNARDRGRDRGVDLTRYRWVDTMEAMAEQNDVDVVVELVGGAGGRALDLARASLSRAKHFVTANKAMVAHHGMGLAQTAEAKGVALKFEAAVAGGIPAVKGLREGAAANNIRRIYGILNGTANYILSAMESTGADFTATLRDAQALGYAEADPTFDVEGVDAAHKLAILACIGFGTRMDFAGVTCEGIGHIRAADIAQADALGYVIRLIAMADMGGADMGVADMGSADGNADMGEGALLQEVKPCLVPKGHPLAHVTGATNAVVAEGDFSGRLLFQGAGAGEGPTASAVVADLLDIARGENSGGENVDGKNIGGTGAPFSMPVAQLRVVDAADPGDRIGQTYLRFAVRDQPGVLAEITAAMRDAEVSIESLIQKGRAIDGGEVLVAMVTHEGPRSGVAKAMALLAQSDALTAPPLAMKILRN